MALAFSDPTFLEIIKTKINETFDVKWFGEMHSFIGSSIKRIAIGILVNQKQYRIRNLHSFGIPLSNVVYTLLNSSIYLRSPTSEEHRVLKIPVPTLLLNHRRHIVHFHLHETRHIFPSFNIVSSPSWTLRMPSQHGKALTDLYMQYNQLCTTLFKYIPSSWPISSHTLRSTGAETSIQEAQQ